MAAIIRTYRDATYRGPSYVVDDNRSSLPRAFSAAISSVRTSLPTVLFSRVGFGGEAMVLTDDTPNLRAVRGRNFDNRTRSILVRPVTIELNVIVGADETTPSRSFDLINRDVADANRIFGPYGIMVDVDRLSVGGAVLHTPHTIETFGQERDRLRSDDHLNVTYLDGPLYRADSWHWRVRSARVTARSGRPSATLHDQTDFRGRSVRVGAEMTTIPASHRGRVLSLSLTKHSEITVYSEPGFGGQARTFRNAVADLSTRFGYFDWWGSNLARATGTAGDWSGFDVWLQPGSASNLLAWGVGQAMQIPVGSSITHQQAESAYRHLFGNAALRRALTNG